jgi:hypothetical protein
MHEGTNHRAKQKVRSSPGIKRAGVSKIFGSEAAPATRRLHHFPPHSHPPHSMGKPWRRRELGGTGANRR